MIQGRKHFFFSLTDEWKVLHDNVIGIRVSPLTDHSRDADRVSVCNCLESVHFALAIIFKVGMN